MNSVAMWDLLRCLAGYEGHSRGHASGSLDMQDEPGSLLSSASVTTKDTLGSCSASEAAASSDVR